MKLSAKNLDEILDGCERGERKYQEIVYESLYGKMMSTCLRYSKDSDDAKDLLQESFIKVFTKVSKFNRDGSFEGWVRRIVVNTAIDEIRKNKKKKLINESNNDVLLNIADDNWKEEDSLLTTIKPEYIMKALQELSPSYKAVFNLYVIENYSHQEIADELQISVGTSKSNLSKAKQNLKKILSVKYLNNNE